MYTRRIYPVPLLGGCNRGNLFEENEFCQRSFSVNFYNRDVVRFSHGGGGGVAYEEVSTSTNNGTNTL